MRTSRQRARRYWTTHGVFTLVLAVWVTASGCFSTLGHVAETVKTRQMADKEQYRASYPEVKAWALGVADGYDSRATMSRHAINFGALLAGAAASTVTALAAFSPGSSAIVGIPIGTAFLATGAAVYNSEPKAVIYRYAGDTVKELVRRSDDRLETSKAASTEALCLQGNVYGVMRRVAHHINLLDPKNVSDRLKAVGSNDPAGLQKLATDVTTDYTDLRRVADGCPKPFNVTFVQSNAVAPGGTTIVHVEGGESPYSAASQDPAATGALTVSPPVSEGDTAKVTIKANDGAKAGRYGVAIKDNAGGSRVAVVSVGEPVAPQPLKITPALGDQSELTPRKGEVAGFIVSGGTAPYTSLGPAAGSEGAIDVTPVNAQELTPPAVVTVTLTDKARAGATYVARVRDAKNQTQFFAVRVKAGAPLRVEPMGRSAQQSVRPKDVLFFVIEGGIPPYKASEPGGSFALDLDPAAGTAFERPSLTVKVNDNARAGQVYAVKVDDAHGQSQQVMIFVQGGDPAVLVLDADLVRRVQGRLKALGYDPKGIDGEMGQNTQTALRAFQRDKALTVNGRIDGPTLRALSVP